MSGSTDHEAWSDEALFAAWADQQDSRAGERLFHRYFPKILQFFRNRLGDDVQDLVQATFLACVEARARFQGRSSFKGFLYGIARNQFLKELTRKYKRRSVDAAVTSLHDLGPTPSYVVDRREERELVLMALQRIPIDSQIALELYYLEGLSGPEVAEALEIGQPAVRGRLRRALGYVREQLEQLATTPALRAASLQTIEAWARSLPWTPE